MRRRRILGFRSRNPLVWWTRSWIRFQQCHILMKRTSCWRAATEEVTSSGNDGTQVRVRVQNGTIGLTCSIGISAIINHMLTIASQERGSVAQKARNGQSTSARVARSSKMDDVNCSRACCTSLGTPQVSPWKPVSQLRAEIGLHDECTQIVRSLLTRNSTPAGQRTSRRRHFHCSSGR